MGTKVAPTYATLVLGYLEDILYDKIEQSSGTEFSDFLKNNVLRFLDDCFIIWPPDQNINEFHNHWWENQQFHVSLYLYIVMLDNWQVCISRA